MKVYVVAVSCSVMAVLFYGCSEQKKIVAGETAKESAVKKEQSSQGSLSRDEKKTLLKIARDTIEKYVREKKVADLKDYTVTERMRGPGGAFVTITNPTRSNPVYPETLRGCIGNFFSSAPLVETIREMAVSACSSDTRFPPVSESEFKDIKIEISALSPLMPIKDPLSIQKGVHGIYIKPKRGFGGGTYLPQVWSEHFPDKDAAFFWNHLCQYKAGLPEDAWRHPDQYEVLVYTADVFGEGE
ncbi:MAG: AmmeMemoRadiSam system protein A [Candidatus Aureabacteria bacterium]|nr:AmmeMemoRadiSam system protein A [Candidatus Auribacterota bacterium]